jgi:hypothetical protein
MAKKKGNATVIKTNPLKGGGKPKGTPKATPMRQTGRSKGGK